MNSVAHLKTAEMSEPVKDTPPTFAPPSPASAVPASTGTLTTWMPRPKAPEGCAPGLEYMTVLEELYVSPLPKANKGTDEEEENDKYVVKNDQGQQVYIVEEEGGECKSRCGGSTREYNITVYDNTGQEVIFASKSLNCCDDYSCWGCMEVKIEAPPGRRIGAVRKDCGLTSPQFSTRDYNNEYAFSFDGPCVCKCCCSQEFVVRDDEGDGLGRILKEREFLTQDYLDKITDADFFGIEFPVELEVRNKAVLLIGLFVIDFMYFEKKQ